LQELVAGQLPGGRHRNYLVKFGIPSDGILQAVAEENADLIVMGVRGADSLARPTRHLGATTDRVVSEGSVLPCADHSGTRLKVSRTLNIESWLL